MDSLVASGAISLDSLRNQIEVSEDPQEPMEKLRTELRDRWDASQTARKIEPLHEVVELDMRLLRLYDPLTDSYFWKCRDLSEDFMMLYGETERFVDLARAVYFARLTATILLTPSQPSLSQKRGTVAATASMILLELAELRGMRAYFEEAVALARIATTSVGIDDRAGEIFLENLSFVLERKFIALKDRASLQEVIDILETKQTNSPVPEDDGLLQLGTAYFQSWELYRDRRDLEKALEVFEKSLIAASDPPETRHRQLHYVNRLFGVYLYKPEVQYLDKITELLAQAAKIPPDSYESSLQEQIACGALFEMRAERSNDQEFARLALDAYEDILATMPPGFKDRSLVLSNFINCSIRFCAYGKGGVEETKAYVDKAESRLVEDSFVSTPMILLNSARLQYLWYQQSNDEEALREAVRRVRKALESDDSRMAVLAGAILKDYWILTKLPKDFDAAFSLLMASWESHHESPHAKVQAARLAADMLYRAGRLEEAWHLLKQAVGLITIACPRKLERDDQRFIISTLFGLSNDACAVGIAAGAELAEVLQTLERGRGIAIALAHGADEELHDLSPEVRDLNDRFEESKSRVYFESLSTNLSQLDADDTTNVKVNEMRNEIFDEFQSLSSVVEGTPQLAALVKPPSKEFFQGLASEGPIVVTNSSSFRNDVILVLKSGISSFEIKTDTEEIRQRYGRRIEVEDVARHIVELIKRGDKGEWSKIWMRNKALQGMLMWLWDLLVKRVCAELGLLSPMQDSDVRRIWWLPTGYFTQMPFHAAGQFLEDSPSEIMMNRAISSYVSSFRLLHWARSRSRNIGNAKLEGMIVTMAAPNPSASRRPRAGTIFVRTATEEADAVEEEARRISWLREDRPSAARVLEEVPRQTFMHFACHGESDPFEPSQSHLRLFQRVVESDDDPRNVDRLTTASISTAVTDVSILAVLSACFTTEIRELSHLDEGLQIGNAFQVAGFPHVIGSLWAASDVICPRWSRKFYSSLTSFMETDPLENDQIACAYHRAVVDAANEQPDFAILWAPFIHLGP